MGLVKPVKAASKAASRVRSNGNHSRAQSMGWVLLPAMTLSYM
jgi:hypothetical protein